MGHGTWKKLIGGTDGQTDDGEFNSPPPHRVRAGDKKCVKGDNWSVKGPTKNMYILNAEVVLITVWGGVFPNQWEYCRLCYFGSNWDISTFVKITQDVNGRP